MSVRPPTISFNRGSTGASYSAQSNLPTYQTPSYQQEASLSYQQPTVQYQAPAPTVSYQQPAASRGSYGYRQTQEVAVAVPVQPTYNQQVTTQSYAVPQQQTVVTQQYRAPAVSATAEVEPRPAAYRTSQSQYAASPKEQSTCCTLPCLAIIGVLGLIGVTLALLFGLGVIGGAPTVSSQSSGIAANATVNATAPAAISLNSGTTSSSSSSSTQPAGTTTVSSTTTNGTASGSTTVTPIPISSTTTTTQTTSTTSTTTQ